MDQRRKDREQMVICVYQYLLLEKNIQAIFENNEIDNNKVIQIVNDVVINEARLKAAVSEHLKKGWSFARLGYMEQAIFLISIAIFESNEPKAIVINEAVRLAKKYCDPNTYRLINGVLDKCLQES